MARDKMNKRDIVEIINGIDVVYLNYLLLFFGGLVIGLWIGYFVGIIQC